MNCTTCGTSNPENQKYCGECGDKLKSTAVSEGDLRQQVKTILREEMKDKNLVEIEILEGIVTRISTWTKLLGFFAGIPLAILILILSVLGIKNYTDVSATASAAVQNIATMKSEVEKKLAPLGENASALEKQLAARGKEASALGKQTQELTTQLASVRPQIEAMRTTAAANSQDLKDLKIAVADIQTIVTKPGSERWQVKTGTDPDARLVSSGPSTKTTVEELSKLARPPELQPATKAFPPEYSAKRAAPVELTIYSVEAEMIALKVEVDGDYHIVLQGASGARVVAEIPDPDHHFTDPSSRWVKEIAAARKAVDQKVSPDANRTGVIHLRAHVRVTGVGFFDRVHGAMGTTPNGIELHPVIGIDFLE